MTTRIVTRRYEAAHGKRPRGEGFWMFETWHKEVVFSHNGQYQAARGMANEWAKKNGHAVLYVSP